MKKIFTLFVAFLALTFCAKAQVTIILEAHDVWQDGSGYQLLLDADHNTFGTVIPATGPLSDGGDVAASVYAEFEYTVPVGADGSLTTQNIVYDGTATITIPAGTYDFCITNPTPNDRMWIAGGNIDPTRADDYVFENGNIYHFQMIRDGNNDACQLTISVNPTSPTIAPSPTAVNFGNVLLGNSATSNVTVNNYLLTAPVTATTTAPFEISTDGTTFATTATIPTTGGTLTIRYTPTTTGVSNGTVTLSSTGATDATITLTGAGLDCSNITVPFTEGFESTIDCWSMVSADPANDDRFGIYADASAYEGNYDFRFSSYSTATDYNQYLISPELTLTGNDAYVLSFFYKGYNSSENFRVLYSTTNNSLSSFTQLADFTNVATTWTQVSLELPAGTKYFAIDYYGNYQFYLYVDNISVGNATPSIALNLDAIDFGTEPMGTISDVEEVELTAISITTPITLSVVAPFEVSIDSINFAATATIPASNTAVANRTFYVRFAPTAVGTFTQNLTVTNGTLSETVALTGSAVDCSGGIASLPYSFGFNDAIVPPLCWTVGYDPTYFFAAGTGVEGDYAIGIGDVDMLITPEIHTTNAMLVSFQYINYFGTSATEPTYFHVGYSTTDNNPNSFTWQSDNLCAVDEFADFTTVVPAGTKYLAIGVSELGTGLYYGMFEEDDVFYIDNLSLTELAQPTMIVAPESMSFGSIMYGTPSNELPASVVGALLANDITVNAPANFEVSTNGISFASTATLPDDGGLFYVRYNPTAIGSHNGNITLTSGNTTKTIAVSGTAVDCSGARTLPFTEDFNNDEIPACWLVNSTSEETWIINTDQEGNVAAYCNYAGEGIQQDEDLITPTLDLTGYNTVTLTFQFMASNTYVMNDDPEEQYTLYIYTSTNGGTSYSATPIFDLRDVEFENWDWTTATVDLTPLAGNSNVKLNFNYYGMYGGELWMDDVNITGTVGVNEYDNVVRIYPNPVQNMLNINANSNIDRVEVYNMMGQMVGSYNVNESNTQINTSNYANGVYTVKISTENGMTTQKFTVAR